MRRLLFSLCSASALALFLACSGARSSGFDDPVPDAGANEGGPGPGSSSGGLPTGDASPDTGGPTLIAEVWGHSRDTLYKLDPDSKAVNAIAER